MQVIESLGRMRAVCAQLARERKSIRLVPTMGALHAGHGSLIKRAREDASPSGGNDEQDHEGDEVEEEEEPQRQQQQQDSRTGHGDEHERSARVVVVVSIFVNPIQFNDPADLAKYPRTTDADLALCRALSVDFVFMPRAQDILPEAATTTTTTGASQRVTVRPPEGLARELEGRSRPGHFEGVLTIVAKLLNIVRPERAYFGEKDYQQLVLVRRMCADLNMGTRVCPVATAREPDTRLPLSSRNVRLAPEQRRLAARLMSETLFATARLLEEQCARLDAPNNNGRRVEATLVGARERAAHEQSGATTDYLELRCARDLTEIHYDHTRRLYDCRRGCCCCPEARAGAAQTCGRRVLEARLLMSILVAGVRLLDNVAVRLNLPGAGRAD